MSLAWRKVWRDLIRNKVRTLLVVLSTGVGIFALGLVIGLSGILRTRIMESHQAARPAHITFWGGPFGSDEVDAVQREPGVAAVEGETVTSFRWKLAHEEDWHDGDLFARADYGAQRVGLLRLLDGCWPDEQAIRSSAKRALNVERLSSHHYSISIGTPVLVEFGERERSVPIEGIVRAPVALPPEWGGDAMFFATPETVAWVSGSEGGEDFNRLHVRLHSYSEEAAERMAERIEDRLEGTGLSVDGYEITDPNEHWVQDIVDAVTMILMVMSILSLGLSAFLIVNTMNAILVQQVWQIGVMKAIGATFGRVMRAYLATALIYGGLALLLAVPLGVVGAHVAAVWLLDALNIELDTFRADPVALGVQIGVGAIVPVMAALVPVVGGVSVTVREAIGSHGIGSDFGRGWFDQLIGHIRVLPRPMALSLRNVFRRKRRVALALATLTLSGAMFGMVLSMGDSLLGAVEKWTPQA